MARKKVWLAVFLLGVFIQIILPTTSFVHAEGISERGAITHGPSSPVHAFFVPKSNLSPLKYDFLTDCTSNITNNGDGSVTLSGKTATSQNVAEIGVTLYLQQWDGNQWVTISSGYSFTDKNKNMIIGEKKIAVSKGYYYRTQTVHSAKNGSIQESMINYSDYVLIPK